ncbi:hypothetical protein [Methanosarcina sp.]|uniref:hypothetical protein n=1 Tax=Methanosarcina sp. TaxID=2213 RepID=UPI002AB8CD29|nr:hypothetical protein [Methanosarcina sp.]MDY9925592.1 hypothetical protein [Methanosarcina sp.]
MVNGHNGSRSRDGSYSVKSIFDTELGNPYTLLSRGMEVARLTNGVDGRGCFKKRMPACNGQDRGLCLSLKGRRLETGVSRQRREVNQ